MRKSVKVIRIIVFSIILIFFMCAVSDTLAKYGDAIKVRNILYNSLPFLLIAYIVLIVMLVINPKWKVTRVTILDVVSIVMFIVLLAIGQKEVSSMTELKNFQGNNIYASFYSNGIGGSRGYDDMEGLLKESIEFAKNTGDHNEMEEIYRIQAGEKIFVYCKVDEEYVVEFDFIEQNDLYYYLGELYILYDWIGYDGRYTEEATIKTDIVHTMRRDGVKRLEGAPAWGVSTDEQIASMMINGEPVDEVILVNEVDEKKYYFWLIMNVEEIKTLDDVIEAEVTYEDEKITHEDMKNNDIVTESDWVNVELHYIGSAKTNYFKEKVSHPHDKFYVHTDGELTYSFGDYQFLYDYSHYQTEDQWYEFYDVDFDPQSALEKGGDSYYVFSLGRKLEWLQYNPNEISQFGGVMNRAGKEWDAEIEEDMVYFYEFEYSGKNYLARVEMEF